MMKVMDKLRPAEFPPAFRWLVWEVLHGLGEDLSGCSAKTVDSQNPFYFSTVSEFPSWHLSPQTCPVSGKGRFISSLCFTAGVRRGFFCLTLRRCLLLFLSMQPMQAFLPGPGQVGDAGNFPLAQGHRYQNETPPSQMHTCLSVDCCRICLHILEDN